MEILIWSGAAITLIGLGLLVWCILRVARARKSGLDEETMRAELRRVVPMNTGALFLSVIGLMLVVLGITLR
ncbi:MAG: hypothetical protein NXH74_13000 [Rhodobacteraceae bacterium]|jgi:uncharacterized membrane protein|nr:hypothetical protein [Paracoccaceae bacterium]